MHSHLDVVPAEPSDWSVHPFSGEVSGGYVWGRGAVDMKHMAAMSLAVARRFRRDGVVPPRDLVFAYLADEEAGGGNGAGWLVQHRPELFDGVTEAISEVGGFSLTVADGVRAYLVETAEKGVGWLRLYTRGTAGHGSLLHTDNAVAKLAAAVARLDAHEFPLVLTPPVRDFLAGVSELTGVPFDEDDPSAALGPARLRRPHDRRDPARHRERHHVHRRLQGQRRPVVAAAIFDCRTLPGREEAFLREVDAVVGPGVSGSGRACRRCRPGFDGALVDAMTAAITAEDPDARLLPYMLSAGTDAKAFQRLGIRHLGFAPLRLPPDLDFTALFHGVDERVPVDGLLFGTRVLDRFLRMC